MARDTDQMDKTEFEAYMAREFAAALIAQAKALAAVYGASREGH